MWLVRLLVVSLGCLAGGYGVPVPEDSLKLLLGKVLDRTREELAKPRPLADFSHRIEFKLFHLIPFQLELTGRNVTQTGPIHIRTVEGVRGEKSTDGKSLFLETRLQLTDITVKYNYLLIDFFGYKYSTVGELRKPYSRSDLSLRFEQEDVLHGCQRTISSVSEPNGPIAIVIGNPGDIAYYITYLIDFIIVYFSKSTFQDGQYLFSIFFPNVQEVIMNIMNSYEINCPGPANYVN